MLTCASAFVCVSFGFVLIDPDQNKLRSAISSYVGLPTSHILCGAGSDESIDMLFRAFNPSGCFISSPTFSMYDFFGRINQTAVVDVPRGEPPAFALDTDGLISRIQNFSRPTAGAKMVCIASPNNPTGGVIARKELEQLLLCDPDVCVVVDEAYGEFMDRASDALELYRTGRYQNLVILRTFSKFAGLAGLRVGYLLAHPSLVEAMLQIKQPYNINVAADAAVRHCLSAGPPSTAAYSEH